MNRCDLQALSRERLRDANVLLTKGQHVGAYYLAGYAVECAQTVTDSHTHDLVKLVGVAELNRELDATSSTDEAFERNWLIIKRWRAEDRYNLDISADEARDLYRAIAARNGGMMAWIRRHW